MNIHEYQAKRILKGYGAPVVKGVAITDITRVASAIASLPGPVWVVKSQIHAGGRGKGHFKDLPDAKGGVRVCFSADGGGTERQGNVWRTLITKQTQQGKQVNRLYIEDGADIEDELYLSILVDRATAQVSFIVSRARWYGY